MEIAFVLGPCRNERSNSIIVNFKFPSRSLRASTLCSSTTSPRRTRPRPAGFPSAATPPPKGATRTAPRASPRRVSARCPDNHGAPRGSPAPPPGRTSRRRRRRSPPPPRGRFRPRRRRRRASAAPRTARETRRPRSARTRGPRRCARVWVSRGTTNRSRRSRPATPDLEPRLMIDPGGVRDGDSEGFPVAAASRTHAGVTTGAPMADAYRHFSVRPGAAFRGDDARVIRRIGRDGLRRAGGGRRGERLERSAVPGLGIWLSTTPPFRTISSARARTRRGRIRRGRR